MNAAQKHNSLKGPNREQLGFLFKGISYCVNWTGIQTIPVKVALICNICIHLRAFTTNFFEQEFLVHQQHICRIENNTAALAWQINCQEIINIIILINVKIVSIIIIV